jgi:hypothetical protein
MFFGRLEATENDLRSGVKNKNDAAIDITTEDRPPRVTLQPGANGNNDKTDNI